MPEAREAWAMLEGSDLVAGAAQVDAGVERVAQAIRAKLGERFPLVLVVMGGAVVFAGQLLPRLRIPLHLDYVHATRYGDATSGGGVKWKVPVPPGVRGRCVLVLDDILDGGFTMLAIRERVLALGASEFHCAVLVDKALGRPKPIAADFVGFAIPDRFVFGAGMDAKGLWRNLPEIRAMRSA
jgi:hypoxanthine phosphoribosyltransferase